MYIFYETPNPTSSNPQIAKPTLIYYQDPLPPDLESQPHFTTQTLPSPNPSQNQDSTMFINLETGEIYYEYTLKPQTDTEIIAKNLDELKVNLYDINKINNIVLYCIAPITYWQTLNINTINLRKSLDGIYAVESYDFIKTIIPNIDKDVNVKIIPYTYDQLNNALTIGWADNTISLENAKQYQLDRIGRICNAEILAGFDSNAKDGITIKHYTFSYEDQINLSGITTMILKQYVLTGSFNGIIEWKNSEQTECDTDWSIQSFMSLCNSAENFKTERIKKCHSLNTLIKNATTISEINNVIW